MRSKLIARLIGAGLLGGAGYQLGSWLGSAVGSGQLVLVLALTVAVLGGGIGMIFAPAVTIAPFNHTRRRLAAMAVGDLVAVGVGVLLGLILSALLTFPLGALPGLPGSVAPVIAAVAACYISVTVLLARHRELADYVTQRKFLSGAPRKPVESPRYLLDTSAIIDGRIADVSATGFLCGDLLVPHFVLRELQAIADSSDPLRRNRGRRGLDMLARLQAESSMPVEVLEISANGYPDVDSKLVAAARELSYPIITNDYNLNKVATLQGVKILNVNELARSVKPVLLPGEEARVRIIQEGRELNQGGGYLEDGTMIVVENGRSRLNQEVEVTVTRILQTTAGRMIFAQIATEGLRR
ncbi:MAG: PIN domain nuclease [Chloroflexia bacterium]|nr:PIN domain nuclease [Chloroflexia bacterium]